MQRLRITLPVWMLICLLFLFGLDSCKKSSTEPPLLLGPDTTSHNWVFTTFIFGDNAGYQSLFNDVAIVNDTLAYAVGEVYLKDSAGATEDNPSAYNLARWDGREWHLVRVPFYGPCSGGIHSPPLRAFWVFSSEKMLLSDGGVIALYDGKQPVYSDCQTNTLLTGAVSRLFARSESDVYAVGDRGAAIHFNGTSWQKLTSSTATLITDIYGASPQGEINCVAGNFFEPSGERLILRFPSGSTTAERSPTPSDKLMNAIWTPDAKTLYVAGSGLYENSTGTWAKAALPAISTNCIRGNGPNDIIVGGDFGLICHYSGKSWQTYFPAPDVDYTSISMRGNLVMLAGYKGIAGLAAVTIGRRE